MYCAIKTAEQARPSKKAHQSALVCLGLLTRKRYLYTASGEDIDVEAVPAAVYESK